MKHFIVALSLLLAFGSAKAQYGNEWINYNQTYFKFKTAKDGIYRLNHKTLRDAGVPLASIDARNIQVFRNGVEEFIWLQGESDGQFDSTDYIEFFGTYNNGILDAPLFRYPSEQSHQYTSFFQDTTVYFLTWSQTNRGKRYTINADQNYTGLTPDPYFIYESVSYFTNQWLDGLPYSDLGYYAEYTTGEGYVSSNIGGSGRNFSLATPNYDSSGPSPKASVIGFTESNPAQFDVNGNNHQFDFYLINGTNQQLIFTKMLRGYAKVEELDVVIPKKLVGTTTVFRFVSSYGAKGRQVVSLLKLTYPRNFNLSNNSKLSVKLTSNNTFVKFINYPTSKSKPLVYNLDNGFKYSPVLVGSDLLFKNGGDKGNIYICDETEIVNIQSISPVKFNNFDAISGQFDYLVISHSSLKTGSETYKDYRESPIGGSHSILLSYADELYDEYYYGIHHPLALRNWIYSIYNRQTVKPEYLLLLGKGQMYINYTFNSVIRDKGDLVPTMGWPPSDYLFTSRLDSKNLRPDIATGRIPAKNNSEIISYLDKIKEYELYPITTKKVLQLGGGADLDESLLFDNYLIQFGKIIESDSFGGNTTLLSKRSSITVDQSLIGQITGIVNDGVNFVNYFGHGAAAVTEIDFGKVQNYRNKGKYPVFFFDGCILGNSFEASPSLLEEFILEPDKGAIAWFAGSFYGNTFDLFSITNTFHLNAFRTNYGQPIGKIMQQTIKDYQNINFPSNISHSRFMLLHGDPTIKLYSPQKPDYTSSNQTLGIDVNINSVDSFYLFAEIQNLGKVTYDSVPCLLTLSNGGNILFKDTIHSGRFAKTITIQKKLPKSKLLGGINHITMEIDPSNKIGELGPLGESNNVFQNDVFVQSSKLEILTPVQDQIISIPQFDIQFTNYMSSTAPVTYKVLLDTVPSFNSPLLTTKQVESSNLLNKVSMALPPFDSTDFYFAVIHTANDDTARGTIAYIFNSNHGLSQGYWEKFKQSPKSGLNISKNRTYEFNREVSSNIVLVTSGTQIRYGGGGQYGKSLYYGDINYAPGIILLALNPDDESRYYEKNKFNVISGNPWDPADLYARYYGKDSLSCLYRFNTNLKEHRDSLVTFLNRIPEGFYLGFMNETTTGIKNWEEELFVALERFGAAKIRTLPENYPYILWGAKGYSIGEATELQADLTNTITIPEKQYITFSTTIYPLQKVGSITSNSFGPSAKWNAAYIKTNKHNVGDNFSVEIIGTNNNNVDMTLIKGLVNQSYFDLSTIDTKIYPKIKIRVSMQDENKRTPESLRRWTVLFDELPEGIAYVEQSGIDTISEGDGVIVKSVFQNISGVPMDPLVVSTKHSFESGKISIQTDTLKALAPGDSVHYQVVYNPLTSVLSNSFIVQYNPEFQQPERSLSNNAVFNNVYVKPNQTSPLLEVYFDNQQIINGQVINPNAKVSALGRSNHPKMKINDPSLYFVYFIKKGGTKGDTVLWTNSIVSFKEENGANPANFDFNFQNLEAGKYIFLARLKGNSEGSNAAENEYTIEFEVSDKNEITELLPYPNPMVNQCKFAYSFGGRELPTKYHLSIFNINGKLVREVDQFEFGPLGFGNRLSEFTFDGKDNFGDQLANGVYLYKFEIKDADKKQSEIDKYFNAGFGKIYISR